MDHLQLCRSTYQLLQKFDEISDERTSKKVFSNVKHALERSDFSWAREKFLAYKDIDMFAGAVLEDSMQQLKYCLESGESFYEQPITKEVYEYAQGISDLFYGKRAGAAITATTIPYMTHEYLHAKNELYRRYHACHCQFAKESILTEILVSKTLCYCSMGHTKVFWEAALDIHLDGDVLQSALGGDCTCQFVLYLPEEIMKKIRPCQISI